MDITQIILIAAMLGGIILIIAGIFMKAKVKKVTGVGMFGAIIIGAVLAGAGYYFGGDAIIENWQSGGEPPSGGQYIPYTPTETIHDAEFTITPTAQGNSGFTIDSAKTIFSCPAIANTTAHTLDEADNTTWVDPDMKFVVVPIAYAGADALDLATCFFEFNDPDALVNTATSNYYVFTKSGGYRQIEWNVMPAATYGHQYVSGSQSTLLTTPFTVFCNMSINQDSVSRIENVYDPVTMSLTFHNAANTWSKTYTMSLFLILSNAQAT